MHPCLDLLRSLDVEKGKNLIASAEDLKLQRLVTQDLKSSACTYGSGLWLGVALSFWACRSHMGIVYIVDYGWGPAGSALEQDDSCPSSKARNPHTILSESVL